MKEDYINLNKTTKEDSDQDSIVAAASNMSQAAAIVIIRVSGPESHRLLKKCLPKETKIEHAHLRLTKFYDTETGELIDKPMVVFFNSPHSYTGENSAEVHVHGGPYIVRRSLKNLQKAGFRLAEPGEFTRRAYLNNKLDLVASEGINTLITASSEQEWLSAKYLLEGKLQGEVKNLYRKLLECKIVIMLD